MIDNNWIIYKPLYTLKAFDRGPDLVCIGYREFLSDFLGYSYVT